jgi:hypothetical protein
MNSIPRPEILLGLLFICFAVIYAVFRWFAQGPVKPNPWGDDIEEEIQHGEALPICPRCLTPHSEEAYFCDTCGQSVGQYVNWSPYLYIFSLGDILRTGAFGKYMVKPWTVCGYLLFSLGQYSLFAPVFWYRFFMNLGTNEAAPPSGLLPPPAQPPPNPSPSSIPEPPILSPPAG